jgi:hypothetical protein
MNNQNAHTLAAKTLSDTKEGSYFKRQNQGAATCATRTIGGLA